MNKKENNMSVTRADKSVINLYNNHFDPDKAIRKELIVSDSLTIVPCDGGIESFYSATAGMKFGEMTPEIKKNITLLQIQANDTIIPVTVGLLLDLKLNVISNQIEDLQARGIEESVLKEIRTVNGFLIFMVGIAQIIANNDQVLDASSKFLDGVQTLIDSTTKILNPNIGWKQLTVALQMGNFTDM